MEKYRICAGDMIGLCSEGEIIKCQVLFRDSGENRALLHIPPPKGDPDFCSSLVFAHRGKDGFWELPPRLTEAFVNLDEEDVDEVKRILRERRRKEKAERCHNCGCRVHPDA